MKWQQLKSWNWVIIFALLLILAACGGGTNNTETAVVETSPEPESVAVVEPTIETAAETEAAPVEPEPTLPAANTSESEPEPTAVEAAPTIAPTETETAVSAITPIEVTYFTPAQQEGPYYPVNKLDERDNDLVELTGATGVPNGQILAFDGTVYDANGMPLEGVTVEIWQTDASGVYLHPNDPGTDNRDPNFQFYGEAVTDAAGHYSFRTILPGQYEPRPRHIHVKVKLDGQELLTTQFYFAGEVDLQGDDAAMLITAEQAQDEAGNEILVGQRDIILNFTQAN